MAAVYWAFAFGGLLQQVTGMTCGDLQEVYSCNTCSGHPYRKVDLPSASCPYNFDKPACSSAEPQSPRDLSTGATGMKVPKAATLTDEQAEFLPLVNVHYHLGAEHKSDHYSNSSDSAAYDAAKGGAEGRRLAEGAVRPGFMCPSDKLTAAERADYTFQYCEGQVEVGKSYEVHYVHSSAGYTDEEKAAASVDGIADGLGGAANGRGLLNPMVVVQGQVFLIVQGGADVQDMLHGWTVVGHENSVMYPGSTTGPSHDNFVCSPYSITWHVDKDCHRVSPESFDRLCKQMKETYGLKQDLKPHGSRKLLDPKWVVKEEFVLKLM